MINLIKNMILSNIKNTEILNFYNKYLKEQGLLLTIIISIVIVYIIFTMMNSLFKLPIILIGGTLLGLYVYKKYIKDKKNKT